MLVTINTDASFHSQYKIGAYAFWIVCDAGKIMHAGAFKSKVTNSTEAEIMCVANALSVLHKSSFEGVRKVIINTDCQTYSAFVRNSNRRQSETVAKLVGVKTLLVQKYNLQKGWFDVRHVKAHDGIDEKRKWVNNWCDEQAKYWLKEMVNKKRC